MRLHTFKLRFRRFWRRGIIRIIGFSRGAGTQFDQNLIGRLGRLRLVWRFVLLWLVLIGVIAGLLSVQLSALRSYYQVLQPSPGGIYSEGVVGSFTTANPIYAVSDVDTTVAKLLFAGLLTYNDQDQLTGDLASSWGVNESGTQYTVHLRPNLVWQDGQPLTADDVVFTYQTMQDPDAQSPFQSSWQGVTVAAVDRSTVTFTLPNPLSSFAQSLTNGIIPKHILQSVNIVDLRSAAFNTTNPVGAGPFRWGSIGVSGVGQSAQTQITLTPFRTYWASAPRLDQFIVHAYANQDDLVQAYRNQEITAVAGLDSVPASIASDKSSHIYNLPLTAGVYVFFKTTSSILSDAKVRQALVAAADRAAILKRLDFPAIAVDEPLLRGQLGYNPAYAQTTGNLAQAKSLLDQAGWTVQPDGTRAKNGQPLSFTLIVGAGTPYAAVAQQLSSEWQSIGAQAQVTPLLSDDFQDSLSSHSYDAVIDGISIGVDPDVFVYWDSSQADPRSDNQLNFSEYKSTTADLALEAGRTRLDPQLRVAKYRSFLQAWQQDTPALGLYQPRFLYISHIPIYGLHENPVNTDAGRFNNVQNWMVHLDWATR